MLVDGEWARDSWMQWAWYGYVYSCASCFLQVFGILDAEPKLADPSTFSHATAHTHTRSHRLSLPSLFVCVLCGQSYPNHNALLQHMMAGQDTHPLSLITSSYQLPPSVPSSPTNATSTSTSASHQHHGNNGNHRNPAANNICADNAVR